MDDIVYGKIMICEQEYSFSFEKAKKFFFVHPIKRLEISEFIFLENDEKYYENLIGITYDNHLLYFVDVNLVKMSTGEIYGYPKAFIFLQANLLEWKYNAFKFKAIILKSSAIDSLQSLEYAYKIRQNIMNDESIDSKCMGKNFEIEYGKCQVKTHSMVIPYEKKFPIKIENCLKIDLNDETEAYDVYILINKINEVFKFIFNRCNIAMSTIKLITETISVKNLDGNIEEEKFSAHMEYLNQEDEFNGKNINENKEYILNHFQDLIDAVNEEIISYYPKDDEQARYVDNELFIKICGTFEREFELCYPSFLEDTEPVYRMIKQKILDFMTDLDCEYKGKNSEAREKIKSFKNTVEKLNEKLEKRLRYAYSQFEFCLDSKFRMYCRKNNLEEVLPKIIFEEFASKRNQYVHTLKAEKFKREEIVGYLIVRELIYCMILKRAKFSDDEITAMIQSYD